MKRLFFNLAILIGLASFSSCGYNSMVEKEAAVEAQWAQVENVYQRRADLIPNLVNTVKGSADFQKSTLTAVVEARSKATSINIDAKDLTPENLAKFQAAQDELSSAMSKMRQGINVMIESYPQLNSEGFRDLMTELEGTENRISVERRRFNEVVQDYNTTIKTIPNNFFAGMYGFQAKGYFKAQAGADKAPEVKF